MPILRGKTPLQVRAAGLPFLLSFLISAWNMIGTLKGISMQKVTGTAFLAGATAEVLTAFYFGMLVCVVLYAFAFFCETLLLRYKLRYRS
jgi:ABC-type enterochelin transport system permease subunit